MNRIKEAIALYNQKYGEKGPHGQWMTQASLAEVVMKDRDISNTSKHKLMVSWIKETRTIEFKYIRRICEETKMEPRFLIGM